MKRASITIASIGLVAWWIVTVPVGGAKADGSKPPAPTPTAPVPAPAMPPDLAQRAQEVTDAVLENHIDPPARQQMILSGIKALYRAAGEPAPAGLSRRVSAITTAEQLASALAEAWPRATARPSSAEKLERTLLEGLLAAVPGRADLLTVKERNAAEQIAGNRYVGILVALKMDDKERRPSFAQIIEGGPAHRAGIKVNDLLEEIDGVDTRGMDLRDVVERTRGDEGTDVTIKVRSPQESTSRTLKITRGRLPGNQILHPTVLGIPGPPGGKARLRLDGPDPIGYLRIVDITTTTPHELRTMARAMEDIGIRALVLDLRGGGKLTEASVHSAVLLADSLLESGPIGRIRTVRGETTYEADPDALFRGWPIAVLVDQFTSGTVEWVAAALQDNHRAVVVGSPSRGAHRAAPVGGPPIEDDGSGSFGYEATARSTVPIGDGRWFLSIATSYLERGDGRPLADRGGVGLDASSSREKPRGGIRPDRMLPPSREPFPLRPARGAIADASREPDEKAGMPIDPSLNAAAKILHDALEKR